MHRFLRTASVTAVAGAVLVFSVGPVAAAEPARRVPVPVAAVAGLPSPRLDQDTTKTAIVTGASREAPITVRWGDGSTSQGRSTCSVDRAVKRPNACRVELAHEYSKVGTFPIVVRSGKRVIARTSVVVREAPRPWSPPPGWVQPAGWRYLGNGATYVPCSTVRWYYDRSAEPAASVGMKAEIEAGLARLVPETGLTFTETTNPAEADLTFGWGALSGQYTDAAAVGGRVRGEGLVTFSLSHWWPADVWTGFGVVTQPDGTYAVGRGWMVVHETMHALGLAHVDDPSAIMNPLAGATAFNSGDIDGLRTMYLNNPCPV